MTEDERLRLYQLQYKDELELRERVAARVSLPYGILLVLSGAYWYLLNSAESVPAGFLSLLYIIGISGLTVALLRAVYCLIRAYWGYSYSCLPTSQDIEDYWVQLTEHYADDDNSDSLASGAFRKFLLKYYCDASSKNASSNKTRSDYLHFANGALILAFLMAGVAAVPVNYEKVCTVFACVYQIWPKVR